MTHVDHPKVVRDRIIVRVHLPDPTIKRVLQVETQLPMNTQDAGFDQDDYNTLVDAVRDAMERSGTDEAEIITV